ncbi:hypothetical protein NE237_031682 [Protea cynaroides]|uniref:Retrotransposon gag domain-containing protein n=1 Tax=Protea cynaroides TaxID=273540 RepID=A0A9Q0R2C9_9MAGN|nr:hypothetical protein NE237_031682 [Protea cynaroides]
MSGRRVTRQNRNAVPPPPPVEETSQENNYAPGNPEQANSINLPPPPPELATMVMNLAQQMQPMQHAQAQMQVTMGIMFQATQAAPMQSGQASAAPMGNHPAPQTPQQPAAQIPVQAPKAAQVNYQYPPHMFGAYPQNQLDHSQLVERFLKMKPKEFNDKLSDPLWPAHWIDEMERNFLMMTTIEDEKVLCATFMLKGDAHHWWKYPRAYLLTKHALLTWAIYKEAFFEKYFPRSFRDSMEKEFLSLYQGQMSVDAYQQRYEELFFFAPLSMQEEETKIRRFVTGLRGSIREHVLGLEKKIYNEAVQIARVIESIQKESYFTQNRGIKRPAGNSYNGGNNKTFKPFRAQGFTAAPRTTPVVQ